MNHHTDLDLLCSWKLRRRKVESAQHVPQFQEYYLTEFLREFSSCHPGLQ